MSRVEVEVLSARLVDACRVGALPEAWPRVGPDPAGTVRSDCKGDAPMSQNTLGRSEESLSARYDVALLDLDGVVYIGPEPVPGWSPPWARLAPPVCAPPS